MSIHILREILSSSSNTASNSSFSIPLGIIIGLLGSFIQSLGLTIQRKSHVLNQKLPVSAQRVEHRRPLWLLGFAIFISSNIFGSFVQIAALPVVILAPLGAVSLLWNAFFARLLLGDTFSLWMVLGTILIAGGAVLIAVFGIVPEPTRSLEDLLALFSRPAFVVYFSMLGSALLLLLVGTHVVEYRFNRRMAVVCSPPLTPSSIHLTLPSNPSTLTTGVTDTITDTITTERTPLLDRKPSSSSPESSVLSFSKFTSPSATRTRLWLSIAYASFSGFISGMCLLFAKSGVELLLLTLKGQNQFWRWQAWVLILGLVVFALLQLWYLHKALILANPTLVCPSAFCFYNLSSIVNGLVYFDQFSLIKPIHLFLVGVGIIVLLGGVWVVSIHSGSSEPANGSESWTDSDADCSASEGSDIEEASHLLTPPRQTQPERTARSHSDPGVLALSSSPKQGVGLPSPRRQVSLKQPATSSQETQRRSYTQSYVQNPLTMPSTGAGRSRRASTRPTLEPRTLLSPYGGSISSRSTLLGPRSPKPLDSVASLGGAGFQIGITPVSPAFALVLRGKNTGRRASGMVDGGATESGTGRRRRTVSEGDPMSRHDRRLSEGTGEGGSGGHDDENNARYGTRSEARRVDWVERSWGESPSLEPRQAWGWVARLFGGPWER